MVLRPKAMKVELSYSLVWNKSISSAYITFVDVVGACFSLKILSPFGLNKPSDDQMESSNEASLVNLYRNELDELRRVNCEQTHSYCKVKEAANAFQLALRRAGLSRVIP